MTPTNIAVFGVTGRMGRAVLAALRDTPDFKLTGALASPGNSSLGLDAGTLVGGNPFDVPVTADRDAALAQAEVAVDFTLPEAISESVRACASHRCALVLGATGLPASTMTQVRDCAASIPILYSPNMSIGVNLMLRLVERTARALSEDFEVEIIDIHHRDKLDAPSGTALKLGEAVARARGSDLSRLKVLRREGRNEARSRGQIGFASVRAADHVGEHTVMFSAGGETLSLTHRATDRVIFARGALHAARWLKGRAPGLYDFQDVIS